MTAAVPCPWCLSDETEVEGGFSRPEQGVAFVYVCRCCGERFVREVEVRDAEPATDHV